MTTLPYSLIAAAAGLPFQGGWSDACVRLERKHLVMNPHREPPGGGSA
jgi:hypothetical protein